MAQTDTFSRRIGNLTKDFSRLKKIRPVLIHVMIFLKGYIKVLDIFKITNITIAQREWTNRKLLLPFKDKLSY